MVDIWLINDDMVEKDGGQRKGREEAAGDNRDVTKMNFEISDEL